MVLLMKYPILISQLSFVEFILFYDRNKRFLILCGFIVFVAIFLCYFTYEIYFTAIIGVGSFL